MQMAVGAAILQGLPENVYESESVWESVSLGISTLEKSSWSRVFNLILNLHLDTRS